MKTDVPEFSFGAVMQNKKDPNMIGIAVELVGEVFQRGKFGKERVGYFFWLRLPDSTIYCAVDDFTVIRPGILPFYRGVE